MTPERLKELKELALDGQPAFYPADLSEYMLELIEEIEQLQKRATDLDLLVKAKEESADRWRLRYSEQCSLYHDEAAEKRDLQKKVEVLEEGKARGHKLHGKFVEAIKDVIRWKHSLVGSLNPPNYCPPLDRLEELIKHEPS